MRNLFVLLLTIVTGFGLHKHTEAAVPTEACEDEPCNLVCQYGQAVDSLGCKVCGCEDPCADVECPSNSTCRPIQLLGSDDKKYKGQCIDQTCKDEPCDLVCQYGQAVDSLGCKVCGCQDPCADVECPSNSTCRPIILLGSDDKKYKGQCIDQKCPDTSCDLTCVNGLTLDLTGCPKCTCLDPCAKKNCSIGETCKALKLGLNNDFELQCVGSGTTKGPPTGCFEESCNMSCPFGYPKDIHNCSVCSCAADPCNDKQCDKGYNCKIEKVEDNYYNGKCEVCPHISCENPCAFGYMRYKGCDSCECAPDPCSNTTCPYGSKCLPNSENLPECVTVNPCMELECRLDCLSLGKFNKYKLNCTSCRCDNPCLNAKCQDKSMCFLEQKTYVVDGKEVKVTTGSCREDQKCPNDQLSCNSICFGSLQKDKFGCPSCKCSLACDQTDCGKNKHCVAEQIFTRGNSSNEFRLENEVVQCKDCPKLNCSKNCLYGWRKCETCECAEDPCGNATPNPDKSCQALFFPTYAEPWELSTPSKNIYQDYIYLDKGDARCDKLMQRYLDYLNLSDPVNCDSEGNFKPLQCSGDICWCLNKNGTHTLGLEAVDLLSITCGYYSKEFFQLLSLDDMSFITEEVNRRFKIEFSKHLAQILKVEENQITITSIGKAKGSELNYIVLTSTKQEAESLAMQIKDLSGTTLNLAAEGITFGFRSIAPQPTTHSTKSTSTSTSIIPPIILPTSSSTENKPKLSTSSSENSEEITKLLLLTILLPILVALCAFMVALIIGVCVIKRLKRRPPSISGSLFKEPIVFPENPKLDFDYHPYGHTILSEA